MTYCLRRAFLFALIATTVAAATCTKENRRFCASDRECGAAESCDVVAKECRNSVSPDAGEAGVGGSGDVAATDTASGADDVSNGSDGGSAAACVRAQDCNGDKPICGTNGQCAACGGDPACQALNDPTRTLCDLAAGRCVQCLANVACSAATPICTEGRCGGCKSDLECQGIGDVARSFCDMNAGTCVQCLTSASCPADKPICGAGRTCGGCQSNQECAARNDPTQAVCDAASRRCVECTTSGNCSGAGAPICDLGTKKCVKCSADTQCGAKNPNPGVCLEDGKCATEAETVFVENRPGCSAAGGTAAMPVCAPSDGFARLSASRSVLLVRGSVDGRLTIPSTPGRVFVVGQPNASTELATIPAGGGVGIQVTGGETLVRDIAVRGGVSTTNAAIDVSGSGTKLTLLRVAIENNAGLGVRAASNSQLRMDKSVVQANAAGGLSVSNATYQISNTVFANNGFGLKLEGPVQAMSSFVANTLVSNVGYAASCASGLPHSLGGSIIVGFVDTCATANSVTAAPAFDAARPFRLTSNLACPGGATSSFPPDDIDGQPRTAPVDCGADEYVP